MTDVALFDSNLRQILRTAMPMRANVKETSKLPEHPLENGSVINDHKIINPVEIELTLFLGNNEYKNIYQVIRQLYLSPQLITVQTRTASYVNMTIAELPHEEEAAMADALMMTVKFKEVKYATIQSGTLPASSVQDPSNASTIARGEQQPTTAKVQQSALAEFFQ